MRQGLFPRAIAAQERTATRVVTGAALGPRRASVYVERDGAQYRAATPIGAHRHEQHRPPEADAMLDSTPDALLRALNRAYTRRPMLAIVLGGIFGLALVEGLLLGASVAATLIFGSLALVTVAVVGRREVEHYSEAVEYVLDDHVAQAYRRLVSAFDRVRSGGPVWHMGRRRAGSRGSARRRLVVPTLGLPPRVRSNIRVPALPAGRQTLYFFPDRVLVYDAQMMWGIAYRDLKVRAGDIRDVAESSANGEAREANGFIALASRTGLSAVFRCPDTRAAAEVGAALEALA